MSLSIQQFPSSIFPNEQSLFTRFARIQKLGVGRGMMATCVHVYFYVIMGIYICMVGGRAARSAHKVRRKWK